jgi:hypothetical protein
MLQKVVSAAILVAYIEKKVWRNSSIIYVYSKWVALFTMSTLL